MRRGRYRLRGRRLSVKKMLFFFFSVAIAGQAHGVESGLNPKCPVLTDEDSDPAISTIYQGRKVLLCCPKCRKQFLESPEKYLKNLPQFADLGASAAKTNGPAAPEKASKAQTAETAARAPAPERRPPKIFVSLGRFHPVIVHFPIALILCAALAEFLFLLTGSTVFANSARVMVALGAAGSVAAAALGWLAALDAKYPADLMVILERHRWVGAGASLLAVLAAACSELSRLGGDRQPISKQPEIGVSPRAQRLLWSYRVLLFASAAAVALTGYLGGSLVYGPEHFSLP